MANGWGLQDSVGKQVSVPYIYRASANIRSIFGRPIRRFQTIFFCFKIRTEVNRAARPYDTRTTPSRVLPDLYIVGRSSSGAPCWCRAGRAVASGDSYRPRPAGRLNYLIPPQFRTPVRTHLHTANQRPRGTHLHTASPTAGDSTLGIY